MLERTGHDARRQQPGSVAMIGNQMEPDRGGYTSAYIPANAQNRTYGGVAAIVAQVGGMWDALLSEGRRIWTLADSDSHFEVDANNNSSGYFPGEYAKTRAWIADSTVGIAGPIQSLRDGRSFGSFGDLIDALDFHLTSGTQTAQMGQELAVAAGKTVTVTVRASKAPRSTTTCAPSPASNPVCVTVR